MRDFLLSSLDYIYTIRDTITTQIIIKFNHEKNSIS